MECRLDTISIGGILGLYDICKHCSPNPKISAHSKPLPLRNTTQYFPLLSVFFANQVLIMETVSLLPFTPRILYCWHRIYELTMQAYQRLLQPTQSTQQTKMNVPLQHINSAEPVTVLSEMEIRLEEQLCWSRNHHYLYFVRYEIEKAQNRALHSELEASRASLRGTF